MFLGLSYHDWNEIIGIVFPVWALFWAYVGICFYCATVISLHQLCIGKGFHLIRNFKASCTFIFRFYRSLFAESEDDGKSYRPVGGIQDNLPDSYYKKVHAQAKSRAKANASSWGYQRKWNPIQSVVDGLGDLFGWASNLAEDCFDLVRFRSAGGSGSSGGYSGNWNTNYSSNPIPIGSTKQAPATIGNGAFASVPLQQNTSFQIAPVYYKGVGSLAIAEDIFKHNRFRPSTGHRLHGAWITPDISFAKGYASGGHGCLVELSVKAPQQYWCHMKDIEAHPIYKELSTTQRPKGIDLSQFVYQSGYAVIYINQNEVVIVSPQKGQLFTTPIVTVHRVIDQQGNVILS